MSIPFLSKDASTKSRSSIPFLSSDLPKNYKPIHHVKSLDEMNAERKKREEERLAQVQAEQQTREQPEQKTTTQSVWDFLKGMTQKNMEYKDKEAKGEVPGGPIGTIGAVPVGDGARVRDVAKEFDIRKWEESAPVKVLSKEGLGSKEGAREAIKGVGRFALRVADLAAKTTPAYWLDPRFKKGQKEASQVVKEMLKAEGTDIQKAIGGGFEIGAEMAAYGPIEEAFIKGLTTVPKIAGAVNRSGLTEFGVRRLADIFSGQLLATKEMVEGAPGGRLGIAGFDVVGGTIGESVAGAFRGMLKNAPAVKTGELKDAGFTTRRIGEEVATEATTGVKKATSASEEYLSKQTKHQKTTSAKFRTKSAGQKTLIHPEDIREMKTFNEYVKHPKTKDLDLELNIRQMAKLYDMNPNKTNPQLAKDFDFILDQHDIRMVDKANPVAVDMPKQRAGADFTKDSQGKFTGSNSRKNIEQKLGDVKEVNISDLKRSAFDADRAKKDFGTAKATETELPVLIDKETGYVLDGNGRILRAEAQGETKVRVTSNEAEYRKLSEKAESGKLPSAVEAFRLKDDFEKIGIKISDKQEKEITDLGKKLFGENVDVKVAGQIMTPAGQEALGSYKQGMIKILGGQADAKETMYHEAVHAYLDMFTTKGEQSNLLDVAQKHYGIDDFGEVEEKLAEDFINYAKTHEGTVGQLRAHFDNVLERIKKYFGNEDAVKKLYSDLYTGKAKQTLSEAKGYKAQVGLVQEAITSGDEAAAKSIYKGITKSDYLPSYEKIAKNVKQKRFSAGLAAQAERDMAGYEKALSQRDLIEEAIGEKNIDSVRRLIRSKAAQKSDFDVNKIPGFDEMADEVRTIKNNPQLTDNEVLDMIEKLPTKAEIKKMKPVKIEPVEDLKIIEPEEVGKIEKINEAGGEVVKVPKKQLPIGEGKEKVSKLAARVQGITGKATKEDIERLGLRTYNQMNNKKAIAKSAEFVSNKWDDGLKVLKGEIDPPAGTNEGSIYVAMTQLAKDDSSGKLATDLMGLKATAMGQNTEILKEIDKNNPIKHIDDLIKRKIEAVGGDEKITKMVSKEKSQLKTLSKSETIKGTKQWAERLEQLRC